MAVSHTGLTRLRVMSPRTTAVTARIAPIWSGARRDGAHLTPLQTAEAAVSDTAACHLNVSPADSAASAAGLNPFAISHTAMTISCTASGAMKKPSESSNMLPSGATM